MATKKKRKTKSKPSSVPNMDLRISAADKPRDEAAASREARIKHAQGRAAEYNALGRTREAQGKLESARKAFDIATAYEREVLELERLSKPSDLNVDVTVESPEGVRAVATKTLRDAPLDRLHARKQITEHQYLAGCETRQLFELFGNDGVRAMDFSKDAVDGGRDGGAMGITEAQIRAAKRLRNIRGLLGLEGFNLIVDVLGHRKFIEQVMAERGASGEREARYYARRFRECLDSIAVILGLTVSGAAPKSVRDAHSLIAQVATTPELHRALVAANDTKRLNAETKAITAGRVPVGASKLTLPKGRAA